MSILDDLLVTFDRYQPTHDALKLLEEVPVYIENASDRSTIASIASIVSMLNMVPLTQEGEIKRHQLVSIMFAQIYNLGRMGAEKPTDWRKILLTGKDADDDQERPEPDCGA